ncbi:hypothetical protein [uncultured Microbacterium sp.]|uniref:hypothetical protein n=1 Tax=uncultured Microbacterium sp. TaxID=191216 RepID=UPI0026060F2D|nr:hypothetical protein [uncultured Microbacterium sp.]
MEREVCTCCFLRYAPERYSLTDKRPQVCAECIHHLSDADRRDKEHLRDWRAEHAATTTSYETRLANMRDLLDKSDQEKADLSSALTDAISTISSDYHKAPIGDLRNALESELVTEEQHKAESAYRIRSRAMVVLWRIDRLHNTFETKSKSACKCGTPADRCEILKLLAPFVDELDKWENREKERMRSGRTHGLPADHPDAKKYMQTPGTFWQGPGQFQEHNLGNPFSRRW